DLGGGKTAHADDLVVSQGHGEEQRVHVRVVGGPGGAVVVEHGSTLTAGEDVARTGAGDLVVSDAQTRDVSRRRDRCKSGGAAGVVQEDVLLAGSRPGRAANRPDVVVPGGEDAVEGAGGDAGGDLLQGGAVPPQHGAVLAGKPDLGGRPAAGG